MLALVATRQEPAGLELREVPDPDPAPNEAVVEQRASSLNRGEVRRLPERDEGTIPGWDVAGVVLQPAANGGGPPAGARVTGLVNPGAWAQRVAVPVDQLAEIPDATSFQAAATLPVAGLTAMRALAHGGLLLGRRVLITGAAGGVGRIAIQLARRAGAHVTAVVGSPERGHGLEALGADEVTVGFTAEGEPFDLILESAGGESLANALARVGRGGTVVAFGNSSTEPTTFDVSPFYSTGGARLYGLILFEEIVRTGSASRDLRALAELIASGDLDPEVTLEASWRDPEQPMRALMERRVRGKAVLLFD
jgi:NADPH2:quinone reductase